LAGCALLSRLIRRSLKTRGWGDGKNSKGLSCELRMVDIDKLGMRL